METQFAVQQLPQKNSPVQTSGTKYTKPLLAGAAIFFFLGFAPFLAAPLFSKGELGEFGSWLQGTTASLWAVMVGCLVGAAYLVQSEQLRVQREQLEGEKEQSKEARAQYFLAGFYQILSLHNEMVRDMKHPGTSRTGRDAFKDWSKELVGPMRAECAKLGDMPHEILAASVKHFRNHWQENVHSIQPYLTHLQTLIEMVENSPLPDLAKLQTTTLIRTQMSPGQVIILLYACLLPENERLRLLAGRHSFFHNIQTDLLAQKWHLALLETAKLSSR